MFEVIVKNVTAEEKEKKEHSLSCCHVVMLSCCHIVLSSSHQHINISTSTAVSFVSETSFFWVLAKTIASD